MSSRLLLYRNSGEIFDIPITSGTTFGPSRLLGKWDSDWTHITAFCHGGSIFYLLYKKSSGQAYSMPIYSSSDYGAVTHAGNWETDWAQIVYFSAGGSDYLLLYRETGEAFYMSISGGTSFGPAVSLGKWENDWSHISFLAVRGQPFFLLVRSTGEAFAARISVQQGVARPRLITTISVQNPAARLGKWETDWAKIRPFHSGGNQYLLFYRTSGDVFTAPVTLPGAVAGPADLVNQPSVGATTSVGPRWETDWAEIAGFELSEMTFGIDRIDVINQKSDSSHADNDYLSLAWTIVKGVTKEQLSYSKTIAIRSGAGDPAVAQPVWSGQSIAGPFATDPFRLEEGDLLAIQLVITNLAGHDGNEQFSLAVQNTKKVTGIFFPAAFAILGAATGGPVGLWEGFKQGKDIADAISWGIDGLGFITDASGVRIAPPNCNGTVCAFTWAYNAKELLAAVGVAGSQQIQGPSQAGCGHDPVTTLVWSVQSA